MNHKCVEHTDCQDEHCPICVGGLFSCVNCGLTECSLTTECPNPPEEFQPGDYDQDRICKGELNFVNRLGWFSLPKISEMTYPMKQLLIEDIVKELFTEGTFRTLFDKAMLEKIKKEAEDCNERMEFERIVEPITIEEA